MSGRAHQQLKEELGLDHFEGRTWLGLHHHALLTLISFAFLQHLGLQHAEAARAGPPPDPPLPALRRALLAAPGCLATRPAAGPVAAAVAEGRPWAVRVRTAAGAELDVTRPAVAGDSVLTGEVVERGRAAAMAIPLRDLTLVSVTRPEVGRTVRGTLLVVGVVVAALWELVASLDVEGST